MKKNLFWILLSVLFCACSEQDTGNEYFLRGQEVKIGSTNENLWPYILSGNTMFANGTEGIFYVGKLTPKEWQMSEKLNLDESEWPQLSQGNNGELLMLNMPESGSGSISNGLTSLVKVPNANSIVDVKNQTKWKKYDLSKVSGFAPFCHPFVALSDTTILISGMIQNDIKHLFSIIDYKNQRLTHLDYWPEDSTFSDMDICNRYSLNCSIFGNGKGKFMYKNFSAKDAFIFSIDGTHVNVLNKLYSYTYIPGKFTIERLACCVNSDRIYMLVLNSNNKGEKIKESEAKEPHMYLFGNTVEVYDWDGVKQQVIHLDNYYQEIMLSGDGNTLYLLPGMTDEIIKPAIYSYNISNLEDNPMIDSVEVEKICKANMEKTLEKYGKKRNEYVGEGDMMADFELYDYNDKPHHLNEFLGKGKYIIFEFSGIHCGACQMARPYLEKFYKQKKDKFEMITVSEDKLSEWKEKPNGEVSWHEWNDHNLAIDIRKKYNVDAIPTFFVITPEGKIVKKLEGFTEGRIDEMKEIISGKK